MAKFKFNATISNMGSLDLHLSGLKVVITIGGAPVYTGELGPCTVKPDLPLTVVLNEGVLAVPVASEAFADVGSGMIRLGVTFNGAASAGGFTRVVSFLEKGSLLFGIVLRSYFFIKMGCPDAYFSNIKNVCVNKKACERHRF